jgi:monothiol glutaredoxin
MNPSNLMQHLRYSMSRRTAAPFRAFSAVSGAGNTAKPGAAQENAETHSDFAPVKKTPSGTSQDRIEQHLRESKVVLYMKGSPTAPACGFSWKTVQILGTLNVPFKAYNVLEDDDLRSGIKQFSAWPTIPQLYIDGDFVGGSDIVEGMAQNGELKTLLERAGLYEEVTTSK